MSPLEKWTATCHDGQSNMNILSRSQNLYPKKKFFVNKMKINSFVKPHFNYAVTLLQKEYRRMLGSVIKTS